MPSEPSHKTRREALSLGLTITAGALGVGLSGCGADMPTLFTAATPAPTPVETSDARLGNGSVKVGLLLPLTASGQTGAAGESLRNAAELAIIEFQDANVQLLVKDSGGTPDGARQAAQDALAEGAEILLGPLLAPAVQAAGDVARSAGRPVIAFSTDAGVATTGVYLLSFMPEGEVARIVAYASAQGRRSFAALVPESAYGTVAEAAFRQAVAAQGGRIVTVARYGRDGFAMEEAVERVAPAVSGDAPEADALFIPDGGEALPTLARSLQTAGLSPKVKLLGGGLWNEPRLFDVPALEGGWFAAPDAAGFTAFAARYRERFGAEPTRLATLAYDGASLVAALARTQDGGRFSDTVLTNPAGFNGADGVFRFRPNGTNERGLAVLEIRKGEAVTISPAPRTLGASGT